MLVRRRSCKKSAILPRTLASTTRIIRIWWVVHKFEDAFCFWHLQIARTYLGGTPLTIVTYCAWPLPISARDTQYWSGVRIQEQPRIYLPRFSWIWDRRREATAGSPLVHGEESKVERCRQSAACYLVCFIISAYILATDGLFCGERFCFLLNKARPLLPLESVFFETARAGQGFLSIHHSRVPKLTIYSTCYRDLHQIRWSDESDL